MEQMNMEGLDVVEIDYEDEALPRPVRDFRPVVWKETRTGAESEKIKAPEEVVGYCCLLGADPQRGIFGCGSTAEQALQDWTSHFRERLNTSGNDDELVQEIRDYNSMSKDDVW